MATDNYLPIDEILTHFDSLDSLRLENIDTSDDDGEINLVSPPCITQLMIFHFIQESWQSEHIKS